MTDNLPETIRLVKGDDDVFRADSRDVAEDFGKRHGHVLDSIKDLLQQTRNSLAGAGVAVNSATRIKKPP